MTTASVVPHFKVKIKVCSFRFQLQFIIKLTFLNFWQFFRTKWNSKSLPENPLPLIFFQWRMFMLEKYQRAILGPTSSDSVASLGKEFGNTFSWVCMAFFKKKKKSQPKKVGFWSKQDKFYQYFGHFNNNNNKSFLYLYKS